MTADALFDAYTAEFKRRKFAGGLLVALIRFLRSLDAFGAHADLSAFFQAHPQRTTLADGRTANTLFVESGPDVVGLRPFHNEAERLFRSEHKRFDYPNCAPHATQAWADYRAWLDALVRMAPGAADALERRVTEHVLASLPSHEVDASTIEPLERPFARLLRDFDLTAASGEPRGAAFQGAVFAYIRADAPHLHLDVSKVGAGSKRLQRVEDIDGWDGERLVLSAEAKSYTVPAADVPDFAAFLGTVAARKAMAIIAAQAFAAGVRTDLEGEGALTLDLDDMARVVALWDPLKQRAALAAFAYYVHHIQKNSALISRLRAFEALDSAQTV